jgi:hypothetical protein
MRVLILFLFSAMLLSSSEAQSLRIPQTDEEKKLVIDEAEILIEDVAHGDFSKAITRAHALTVKYPDAPEGYSLEAFAVSLFINYYKSTNERPHLNVLFNLAEEKLNLNLKLNPNDSRCHFFLGGMLGYRGMMEVQEGSLLRAMGTGMRGIEELNKTLKLDPNNFDSYFGLALFHFYRYLYAKFFSWIPAFKDDQKKGYDYLDLAATKGFFLKNEARFRQHSFQLVDKKFQGLSERIIADQKNFPHNLYLHYLLMDFDVENENWSRVLSSAKEALVVLNQEPRAGRSAYFLIHVCQAAALTGLGKKKEADDMLDQLEIEVGRLENWTSNQRYIALMAKTRDKWVRLK